jgi:hypothetical protein
VGIVAAFFVVLALALGRAAKIGDAQIAHMREEAKDRHPSNGWSDHVRVLPDIDVDLPPKALRWRLEHELLIMKNEIDVIETGPWARDQYMRGRSFQIRSDIQRFQAMLAEFDAPEPLIFEEALEEFLTHNDES